MGKTCCFAGHGKYDYNNEIFNNLVNKIELLIMNEGVVNFYVGNYGAFDRMCARAVRSLKQKYSFINLNLVVPYLTAEINDNKEQYYVDFDCILLADIPETTPRRLGIIKCNEYMVKKSDYIICFVKYSWGGAAKTLEYAESKKHIEIINIS